MDNGWMKQASGQLLPMIQKASYRDIQNSKPQRPPKTHHPNSTIADGSELLQQLWLLLICNSTVRPGTGVNIGEGVYIEK